MAAENFQSTAVAGAACGAAKPDQTFSASVNSWLQVQLVLTVVGFLTGNSSLHCEVHIDNMLESKKMETQEKTQNISGFPPEACEYFL